MARLAELDLPERLSPTIPGWATQFGFAIVCSVSAEIARLLVNIVAPGSAVFAFVFPAIMVATLFARWPAGLVTSMVSISYSYFGFFLPSAASRSAVSPILSVFAIAVSAALTVALAEMFRRAVRRATGERDREIADRDLFLEEFDHRVKNNFTIVAGLLDIQRRRSSEPTTRDALGIAAARVDSIARAHRHLYRGGQPGLVEMQDYLGDLCATLADALLLRGSFQLDCIVEPLAIERDRAVSIGLVVNELVTNAAKHAFAGRDGGTITVTLQAKGAAGVEICVADDGVGLPDMPVARQDGSGLGSRLIEAFARQAGGTLHTESDDAGTRVTLTLGV